MSTSNGKNAASAKTSAKTASKVNFMDVIIAKGKANLAQRPITTIPTVKRKKTNVDTFYEDVIDTRETAFKDESVASKVPVPEICSANDDDDVFAKKSTKRKITVPVPSWIASQTAPAFNNHKETSTPPVLIEVLSFHQHGQFNDTKNTFSLPATTSEASAKDEKVEEMAAFLADMKETLGLDSKSEGLSSKSVVTSLATVMPPRTSDFGVKTSSVASNFKQNSTAVSKKPSYVGKDGKVAWEKIPALDLSLIDSDSGAESDTPRNVFEPKNASLVALRIPVIKNTAKSKYKDLNLDEMVDEVRCHYEKRIPDRSDSRD